MKHFGKTIRSLRAVARMSQDELAQASDLSRPTIQLVERSEKCTLRGSNYKKLAAAFKMTPEELDVVWKDGHGVIPTPDYVRPDANTFRLDPRVALLLQTICDTLGIVPERAMEALVWEFTQKKYPTTDILFTSLRELAEWKAHPAAAPTTNSLSSAIRQVAGEAVHAAAGGPGRGAPPPPKGLHRTVGGPKQDSGIRGREK